MESKYLIVYLMSIFYSVAKRSMNPLDLLVALVLKLHVVVSSVLGDQFSEQDKRVEIFWLSLHC